ncbi:hypothetical protein HY745_00395 [Candidatus Desantisbacteria bacterium]|nr:hypothetical protein [Candidatus Desantisbacteria bacterium]
MSGPCEMSGEINKKDGRIDTLLDNGTYKIITYSDPASTGDLILSVNDFKELNQPIPIIKKYKLYEKELNDYEKISYWFKIDTKTTVYFDAIGRSLKDLRIWFEGNWLIDHDLYSETIENSSGKPMIYCRLVAVLNPGYYLLTAYSGEPLKWANEDNKYPFYIRYGIPKINETDMFKDTVSPFGFNHYLITSNSVVGTNYFHLMLNERKEFELKISQCDNPGRSSLNFEVLLGNNKITNKSKDPECEININSGYHNIIVTVIGPPGENFVLQNFSKSHFPYKFFGAGGKYWISTIHSGYFEDNIDISGFLVRINIRQSQIEYSKPIATNVLTLDKDKPWSRHINLLDDNKIVFNIPEDGEYQVTTSGAKALCKFEPYFINLPAGYRTPDFVPANQSFLLLKGYNLLSIKPMKKGILDITVSKVEQKDIQSFKNRITGFLGDLVPDILKSKPQFISSDEMTESSNNNFKGNFQIPGIELYYNDQFTLFLHDQASRNIGVIIRPHALNLAESLPVVLASGEIISFPFYLNENSKLNIKSLKESEVICNIDNKLFENQELNTGHHIIELKNNSKKTDVFFVKSYPVENDITFYLPDNIVTNFSQFQTIEDKAPAFFDLGYNDKKTILFNVSAPGLYKFESLGRLKTNCFIRTRIVTNLFSASENGIGNNFLLNQYLKDGEYQITFGTLEKSSGHMGIKLTKTEIINGGRLKQ